MAIFRCSRCQTVYEDYYPPDDTCIKCNAGTILITTEPDHQESGFPISKEEKSMNMTPITPKVKLHAHQDQDGSHINSLIMKHNGNNYNLYAGTEDIIYVFSQPIALYVLTINREYGTIGLNVYMPPEPFSLNCFYMHSTKHIVSILGPMWEQLPAIEITMKLINYLM